MLEYVSKLGGRVVVPFLMLALQDPLDLHHFLGVAISIVGGDFDKAKVAAQHMQECPELCWEFGGP